MCLPVGTEGGNAVKPLSLSVRCTREEYMQFCAATCRKPLWTTVMGAVSAAAGVAMYLLQGNTHYTAVLLLAVGVVLCMMSPLILPMIKKGEAGRRYDASDALKGAVMLTVQDESLTVRTACQEGTVSLTALTAVKQSADMIALCFGNELTICVPKRSLSDDERSALLSQLSLYVKDR